MLVGLIGSVDGCLQSGEVSTPVESMVETDGSGIVTSITDGDTLRLEVDGAELRVRLTGIDTPEVHPELECFGAEAEQALARLAPVGSRLSFTYDRDPRDRYDRELLYLFTADGTFINLDLVAQGYAEAMLVEPNDRYVDDLRVAEGDAREAGRGLWGEC